MIKWVWIYLHTCVASGDKVGVDVDISAYVRVFGCVYVWIFYCVYVHAYVHVCMCMRMYVHVYLCA